MKRPDRTQTRFATIAMVPLAAGMALTACTSDDSPQDSTDETPVETPTAEPGTETDDEAATDGEDDELAEVFTASQGDCMNSTDLQTEVDCSEPHDAEVFHTFDVPDEDTYPGTDALEEAAAEGCLPQFEPYVGSLPDVTTLEITFLAPSESTWESQNDREIICIAVSTQTLTATLEGSGL